MDVVSNNECLRELKFLQANFEEFDPKGIMDEIVLLFRFTWAKKKKIEEASQHQLAVIIDDEIKNLTPKNPKTNMFKRIGNTFNRKNT